MKILGKQRSLSFLGVLCAVLGRSTVSFQPVATSSSKATRVTLLATPFEKACESFEAAHAEDPRTIQVNGETIPYSVHYHRRMVHHLKEMEPNPKEEVELTARCQHIRRWTRPRSEYPQGRKGYFDWRTAVKVFHAQQAAEILLAAGYSQKVADRVGELLRKENLATDPDVQLLEDVICVVFLENEYTEFIDQEEFADSDADAKLIRIIQKTWKKMTPRGHEAALKLAGQLTERGLRVVETALAASAD